MYNKKKMSKLLMGLEKSCFSVDDIWDLYFSEASDALLLNAPTLIISIIQVV